MEKQLKSTKRYPEDKILTKTMINNYAKNDLLPPPEKKKYTKEHLLLLTFIYYFKSILTIKDIETLLTPITEKYFHSNGPLNITDIYDEVCAFEKDRISLLEADISQIFAKSQESFKNVPEEEQSNLQLFSLICMLGLDVYVKKQIIEKLVDLIPTDTDTDDHKKKINK